MKIICGKCDVPTDYTPEDYIWDFNGYGYDTKYVVCPECGRINIVKYIIDGNFDINNDARYYNKEEKQD